ncbi:MAG: TetR/AcrR family transcriptional regulator [Acidimicrobiales bacterium]
MTARTEARGRPRNPETDAAINAATRRILNEVGYSDLTIEGVARAAGVGRPTVYRRRATKASLVAAALREPLDHVNPVIPDTGDVRRDLRELLFNLVSILTSTDFGTAIVEILAPAARDADLEALFHSTVSERRKVIRTVMQRADDYRRLRVADVETAIDLALGAIYYRHLFGNETLDEAFVERVVEALVGPAGSER